MDKEPRLSDVFCRAIGLPERERACFVGEVCAKHELVKEKVMRLLGHHEVSEQSEFILDRGIAPSTVASGDESVGDRIGSYKLLERIGEGGMGVVYLAEQVEGIRRLAAVKVVKKGMDTKQVVARFQIEQQSLAKFDHANITRVYDAGCTSSGRPYFVMERVEGLSLTTHVAVHKMAIEQRLELFINVCEAVQHAHQNGVIHRDLKPSNILVAVTVDGPVPKVIDFGIAKAIGENSLHETLLTQHVSFLGTPQYMSPEQADGSCVDTRSDIYSLGVILYELLAGSTPLLGCDLRQLGSAELRDTIRNSRHDPPSLRAREEVASLAKQENADDERAFEHDGSSTEQVYLSPIVSVHRDLDFVVMQAIASDPELRYGSVGELIADVKRYLRSEPVLAAPPSAIYRFKKLLKRNRGLAMVTVGLISTVLFFCCLARHGKLKTKKCERGVGPKRPRAERCKIGDCSKC